MSRDYKSRKSKVTTGRKGTLIIGIFIGYTLGIISAIGIWFYLEQAPSPFLPEQQISRYERPDNPSSDLKADGELETAETSSDSATQADEKVQFDFYNILLDDDGQEITQETPNAAEDLPQIEATKVIPVPPVPPTRENRVLPASIEAETFYLQVGSFRSNAEADNLKANLALLGVIASVHSADLSDMGTWYRVRVGPFTQKSRVDQVHDTLRENGIDAQFISVR